MVLRKKKPQKELAEDIAFLIEAADGYRVGRNIDLRKLREVMDRRASDLSDVFKGGLRKKFEKTADYVINLPAINSEAKKWSAVFLVVRLLLRIALLGFMVGLLISISGKEWSSWLFYSSTAILYVVFVLRWYSLLKLEDFYREEFKKRPGRDKILRETANRLIAKLREVIVKHGLEPKKHKLHLFKTDYEGIRILKKPNILRDTYVAEVVLDAQGQSEH